MMQDWLQLIENMNGGVKALRLALLVRVQADGVHGGQAQSLAALKRAVKDRVVTFGRGGGLTRLGGRRGPQLLGQGGGRRGGLGKIGGLGGRGLRL